MTADARFGTLLLSGGCVTDQVNQMVEVDVDDALEPREVFAKYETQMMDSHPRVGARPPLYEFAASFNFKGDLLDFTMNGGVTVAPRRQRIEENGTAGEYSIVLNRKPLDDVTVRAEVVQLVDPAGARVQQLELPSGAFHEVTFTRGNWNREQLVRVAAVDDAYAEGVHYAAITHSAVSLDPNFNGSQVPFLYGRNITMHVEDNDFAGIQLSRTHMFVGEGGMNDSYDVVLTSMPWHPVTIKIVSLHANQTQVATPRLTFAPESWNISQTVIVSGVDDAVSEVEYGGLHYGGRLIHYSESKDFRYHTRRPRCFDVPNCDPWSPTDCIRPELSAPTQSVRVCDLAADCTFTLGNGACVTAATSNADAIPARFGSPHLDPSRRDLKTNDTISYSAAAKMLHEQAQDGLAFQARNSTSGWSFVRPSAELRGFVLSFLGLLNLDQVQAVGLDPKRILHSVCAGFARLETHRWAFEEWPSGYVDQVLEFVLGMFPGVFDERRAWNCGVGLFRGGSTVGVTIWDNDPGVTLSHSTLSVSEGADDGDSSENSTATYSIVLNAPPSFADGSLYPEISMCSSQGSDVCGFWDDYPAIAAQMYSSAKDANVSIAIIASSELAVSPSVVTFTAANWFVPQWITVRAVNDDVAEIDAWHLISHRVQNTPFGYTNSTAFWFQGTLPRGSGRAGSEAIPFNSIPTVLFAPDHQRINVEVVDNDSAGVRVVANQPNKTVRAKEALDLQDWIGDYATAFAFSDVSLSGKSGGTGVALKNTLVLGPNSTTYMKFHLPYTHEGDSKLEFKFATLRFHQTPFKIFNVSDASENSTTNTGDAQVFTKHYRLRVSLIENAWSVKSVSEATNASQIPSSLKFPARKSMEVVAAVERGRSTKVDVTELVAELLSTKSTVVSFRIEVLSGLENTTESTTQICSSLFERKLRPTMVLGYQFPNLLRRSTTSQSSTATDASGNTLLSASIAVDRDRTMSTATSTTRELEPWWESCFGETVKVGQLVLFLPESMYSSELVAIASLHKFDAVSSLQDALSVGCPEACPQSRRLTVRSWVSIWDINAGVRCIRIYRAGIGSLELVEVEVYDPFVAITLTATGASLRSRLKTDWTLQQASDSWRIQQSAKRSEEENLAVGMATRQSSTSVEGAHSYLAVDGQHAASWDSVAVLNLSTSTENAHHVRPGSTRTKLELDPWWEVDLGSVKPISAVKLFPFVGMSGRGFCSSASARSNNNSFPTWSGDLYTYSKTDSLLLLQDPFVQEFEVLITNASLAEASDSASVAVVKQTKLSFSCENAVVSVSWSDAFTKGRFVTIRKRGLGILMLNEVEVLRWNPSVTPRYLLLDLYGDGTNPMTLSSIQLYPPTDASELSAASGNFALPIEYGVHSVSSQLAVSGSGSALALMSVGDNKCYTAARTSFHEWIVLDLYKPTRVGLIELDAGVARCGVNVAQIRSISIAAHGASLDGVRSQSASDALTVAPGTCELGEMGTLTNAATSLTSCKAFICSESACNSHSRATDAGSTLVLSDFCDTVLFGMVEFLPLSRLPLSLNEHRTLLLRDDPAVLWTFDELPKVPVLSGGVDATNTRWTGATEFVSTLTTKRFVVDDTKESSFYSNAVLLQAALPAFSLEFWITGATLQVTSSNLSLTLATLESAGVAFSSIGVSNEYPSGFFKLFDAASQSICVAVIPGDHLPWTSTHTWHHIVASYDPALATISLFVTYQAPGGETLRQESAKAKCRLAMVNKLQKTINFGAYTPTGSAAASGFVGKLSAVAWYPRALSQFEILDHYYDFVTGTSESRTASHSSYSVSLRSKPSAPVLVSINAESNCYRFNLCNVSVTPSTVVINPEQWDEPAHIHVVATYDQLYEGAHTTTLEHSAESEPSYQVETRSTTLDLLVNRTDMNMTVFREYEVTVADFYRDLEVRHVLTDSKVLQQRVTSLKVLRQTWSAQRTESSVLVSDPYNGTLQIDNLSVHIIDATVPGIEFSTSSLVVSEDGRGNDFQVLLLSEPKGVVEVSISVADSCYRECIPATRALCPSQMLQASNNDDSLACGDESTPTKLCNVTIAPDVLYFTSTDWGIPQTVRVVAVDDQLDESDVHLTSIKSTSKSVDPIYDNLFLPDIVVAVEDNDVTDVMYSVKHVALSEKPHGQFNYSTSSYYSLRLATEPWTNVTIAMSNEANKSCYRPCGHHFDKLSCGLPRQQSVTSVRLSTNSTREIHRISLSLPKVTEVQRIVTYASHVDQIYILEVTGGYVPEVQVLTFQFSDAFKLRFGSAGAIAAAMTYGRTLRIGASYRGTRTTVPLDGFASADAVKSALDTLLQVANATLVSRVVAYERSSLRWEVTYARLLYDNATFPALSVSLDAPFEGSVTIARANASTAPTGSFQLRYGAADPLNVSVISSATEMEGMIRDLDAVYLVSVTRVLHDVAYGFVYTIVFKSVEMYESLLVNGSGIVAAPKADNTSIAVVMTQKQSPVRIDGFFDVEYNSTFNSTNNVTRTQPLPWNASEKLVAAEISSINGIGNVTVTRQQLSPEGGMEWTVEFTGNNGQMSPLAVRSLNLTGRDVTVAVDTVRNGESLGGSFVIEMGGKFKKTDPATQRVYWRDVPLRNTTALRFNSTAARMQQTLATLNTTELTNVTREGVDCDAFSVCNGYTWTISYKNSPGDVPPIQVYGKDTLAGAGVTLSSATIANGTYIGGSFSLKLDLFDIDKQVWYTGKTWNLPVNVSATGMDEALEAIPFVRSNREAEFDPETRLWRGITFDKGVRVYREGPYLDGGHTWRLEWAIEDYTRFQDLEVTIDTSLVTQEIEPFTVPTELDLFGAPRCAGIPTSHFKPDTQDPFGLRGWCVYDIANVTIQERFLCNYTVENPWIVFTPENWCIPQRVLLTSVDDFVDEKTIKNGNVTFSNVTHTVFSDDLIYVKLPLDPVLVEVESDDFSEVLVSERYLEVSEDGVLEARYLLQLKTEPLYDVKIVVFPWLDGNQTGCYRFGFCNLTIPVDKFIFTPRDWDVPQTVLVKATDDSLDEFDSHATGISHIAYSDDLKYHKISIPSINVTVFDNDVSAFNVLKTAVYVTEGGKFDEYQIVLGSEPFSKVTVRVTNIGTVGNLAIATPKKLTFTWRDWNISQTVRVDAVDDWTEDVKNSSSVLVHSISSNDVIYLGLKNLTSVNVFITDNDVSGITLSTKVVRAAESNVTVYAYGVRLNSEPWQSVVVQPDANRGCYQRVLSSETVCNVTVLTPRLYFGAANWSEWQNVSFRAVDDWLVEAPVHEVLISHSTTSSDPLYQVKDYSARSGTVQILITDNDLSFVNITLQAPGLASRSQLHVAEGGFNDTYRIVLNSEPYQDVRLTLRPATETIVDLMDNSVVRASQVGMAYGIASSFPSTTSRATTPREIELVFTALDWFQPRVVTVFAIDDKITEDVTQYSSILHAVSSLDPRYNISNSSLGIGSVRVMVNDKEAIPPPIPISATFDASGTKIQVAFDSNVFHAETMAVRPTSEVALDGSLYSFKAKNFNCSMVFNFVAAKYSLGVSATCVWLDLKNLRLDLGSSATITVKDTLQLNECSKMANQTCQATDVIRARHTSRAYTQASVVIQAPSDIAKPTVIIMAPEDAGSCGTWSVDGSLSHGNGGRPFAQLYWFFLPQTFFTAALSSGSADESLARAKVLYARLNQLCAKYAADWKSGKSILVLIPRADLAATPELAFMSTMDQLRSACYLRSLAQSATSALSFNLKIDSNYLEAGVGYVVGLELTNAFDQRSAATKTVKVRNLPGPALFVVGKQSIEVTRVGDPVALQVDSTVSCTELIGTHVGYVWSVTSASFGSAVYFPVDLNKANIAKDPRVFRLHRTSLDAEKSYRFQIEAYMLNSSKSSNSTTVITVNVTSSALVATITGGSRALGERDTLVLDGASSFDPDLSTTPFTYKWSCADITKPALTAFSACTNGSAASLGNVVPLDLSKWGATLTLPPFSLQQNRTLQFTLTVSKRSLASNGTRTSTANSTVWTLQGSVPEVEVTASTVKVTSSARVVLTAHVKSTYPYVSRWVQAQGDLNLPSAFDASAPKTSDAFALPLTSLNNVIVKNKLTSGLTYVFRLVATDVNGNQGFGSVTIKVNSPPSSGRCEVTPKSGYAVYDTFALSCTDWTDDTEDLPLKYSFSAIPTSDFTQLMASTNDTIALGAQLRAKASSLVSEQVLPTASVTMLPPAGLKNNASITIVAFVTDALGSVALAFQSIEVLLPPEVKTNPLGFVGNLLRDGNDTGAKNLLSAASILDGAFKNDASGSCTDAKSGVMCSGHGQCDPTTNECVCIDAYMGANCEFEVNVVRSINNAILSSLDTSSQVVEATPSALSQQAQIIDTVTDASPAAFDELGLDKVASLSRGIVGNAFGLQDPDAFLDSAGNSLVKSLSSVMAITSGASSKVAAGKRRLQTAFVSRLSALKVDCSIDQTESIQAKSVLRNTLSTLHSLAAIASRDALPEEDAVQLSSAQIQALSSSGTNVTSLDGDAVLSVSLTKPAIACLGSDLFVNAFVLATPPHSLCSLREATQLSASIVFAVHSKAALQTTTSAASASVELQTLSSTSLCVAQAAAKYTDEAISSASRRLTTTGDGTAEASAFQWHPLAVLSIPHLRPLTGVEEKNFTTACQVWNAESSTWNKEICFKDSATSSSQRTVCYCSEINTLEVLVTLEERLDYYALSKDLYRNEPASIVPIVTAAALFWIFVLGSKIGQRADASDEKKHKEKTIKNLNRAKWSELQERTQSPTQQENFAAFYARTKRRGNDTQLLSEEQNVVQSGVILDQKDDGDALRATEQVTIADALSVGAQIDSHLVLPSETRALFGTSATVEKQYTGMLTVLRVCNVVLVVIGAILAFVGVDFHWVLGHSTSELLLHVYGKMLGIVLLAFGGVVVAAGSFGLAAARKSATHLSRNTYVSLLLVLLLVQLVFVAVALEYIEDFANMPSALLGSLSSVWNALDTAVREEVEVFYGCCGFASVKEQRMCPEEALDAVPPRTCASVLVHQAREFFGNSFAYLQVLFLVEVLCVAVANVLVKWRHLRIEQLASEPESSSLGATSATRAMLKSQWNVVLLCTLPSLYSILVCVAVFIVVYGVDMVMRLNLVSNAVVSALYGAELGVLLIVVGVSYLLVLLRGIQVLSFRDVRGLFWFAVLSLAILLVSFGISQFFWGIEANLLIDPAIMQTTKARYVAMPRDLLVKLELAMECCGFDVPSEGSCIVTASHPIRSCRATVQQILATELKAFNARVITVVVAEGAVFGLLLMLTVRLRRFAGRAGVHPDGSADAAIAVEIDEFRTPFDIAVRNAYTFTLVLLNLLATLLGLTVVWAGIDAIYELNVLHVSYLLQTIDRKIGSHLVALGTSLVVFASGGFTTAWTRSRRVFAVYVVVGMALFTATFGALGVSYRFSQAVLSSDAASFRLAELWKAAPATTKTFAQNAFGCCGYDRIVTSNGTVEFTDMSEATFWTQVHETTLAQSYTRELSSSAAKTITQRFLTETQSHEFTQAVCPQDASIGCSTVMKDYLAHVTTYTVKVCIAVLSFLASVLLCASVLVVRQGKKTPWKQSWGMWLTRAGVLLISFGSIFASLTSLFLSIDLVGRWAIFGSSLLQLLFARSLGVALLVYAVLGLGVNFYSLYAATNNVVHQLFFQCVGRALFTLSLWVAVGFTGYFSRYSTDEAWTELLNVYLDRRWNTLSPRNQQLISLDYECCGFDDPAVVKGRGIVFDRPALGYTCPLSSARGCRHVLQAQVSSSFGWLFVYLLCLAIAETVLLSLSMLLLKHLKRIKVEEWFAIESRLRYAAGKYRSEARKHHLALSLFRFYDAKFTRGQRLCSVLCAILTTLAVFAGYFATKGCHRKSLKTCEQPDAWAVLGMAFMYGGVTGYLAQCGCRFLFELVRNRCDSETAEVASARQRKEKVLLFRSLFQRRPAHSSPMTTDLRDGKIGVAKSALSPTSLAPSTMDTSHSTTEERWYSWLNRFVYRLYHFVALGLFVVSCGIGTLMGLVLVGFGDTLYGVKIDQGPKELLILALLIAFVSLLAWLAADMRDHKRTTSLVVFATVAIASILLMACALFGVYMVYEVIAENDDPAADNWTVRKTGFSVARRLESAWTNSETSNHFRNRVQQELQCCGFRSASDNAYRPCPTGTAVQVEYEALSVNGSAVAKEQTEVRDLDGCLTKMLQPFHVIADTVAYFAIGVCLAQFLLCVSAVFLAYDVHISKDAKLKLRVHQQRKTDVRQTFEKVVGLKIAAPARGKILSKMLSSSLDSVAPTIASELAAAPLSMQDTEDATTSPTVSSASRLAAVNAPTDAVSPPHRRKSLSASGLRTLLDPTSSDHEAIASVPYPSSIVNVIFLLCGVWIGIMLYLILSSSMELGRATAWMCVICWSIGTGFHVFVIEPGVIFARILWSTVGGWWQRTWLVRLVRFGRQALRIRPDAATAAARYYASLSLYERIRFNAAVRIQRRLLTLVTRHRYLQLIRERRREAHRSLAEQRRVTVKRAIEGFTDDEVKAFRIIFQDADIAKLGLVSHAVISQSIYQLGVHVSPELVFQFLHDHDPAYADLVDFDHFLYGMHCVRMHHHEEQQSAGAVLDDAQKKKKKAVLREEFVSSSTRFGPAADPQAKVVVKRQNMLRELKEKRDSLSYKLMSKMGKLPPLMQRGKSSTTSAESTRMSLDLDSISSERTSASSRSNDTNVVDEAGEAPPTGAFVILQNRKLAPKKRALEMVLKKKHRDDRSKAGGGGGGGSSPTRSPTKAQPASPTQRAKALVQNWKMPSPRGWTSGTNPKSRTEVAIVVEEDEDTAGYESVGATESTLGAPSDDNRAKASEEEESKIVAPTEHSAREEADEDTTPSESLEATRSGGSKPSDSDTRPSSLLSDHHEEDASEASDAAAAVASSASVETSSDVISNLAAADKSDGTADTNSVATKDELEGDDDDDDEGEVHTYQEEKEEKPFGTFMLLSKQAPSAGKSKVLHNILQKKQEVGGGAKQTQGQVAESSSNVDASDGAKDNTIDQAASDAKARPSSPGKAAAKSSLEKALKKKGLGAASGGVRKPGTPKRSGG